MVKHEDGRFTSTNSDFGYYSKLLKKPFDSIEELKAAEDEFNKAHAKEIAVKEERARDVALVQDTANVYLAVVEKNNETRAQLKAEEEKAYKAYKEQLNNFAAKHNGYHLTYTRDGDNVEFKVEENHRSEIEKYFEDQQKYFRDLWDNIFKF